jgi:hypothetical protein
MTATYTFDVFSSLDGYGSYGPPGDWGGYWGKQGPELLDHRLSLYSGGHRMVFGATTFRQFVSMLASSIEASEVRHPWVARMRNLPATVVSRTLEGPLDWPDATVVSGDAVDVVARLEESEVPLRLAIPSPEMPRGANASTTACRSPFNGPSRRGMTRTTTRWPRSKSLTNHKTPASSGSASTTSSAATPRTNHGVLSRRNLLDPTG